MQELIDLAAGQPLGLALLIIFAVMLLTEKIVTGAAYKRALDTIEKQQTTIDDLKAAAAANTKGNELALEFIRSLDQTRRELSGEEDRT